MNGNKTPKTDTENSRELATRLEETGSTLLTIGLGCLFVYLTLATQLGQSVPIFALIIGGGMWGVGRMVRKLTPGLN
jgi:hypothetical protein